MEQITQAEITDFAKAKKAADEATKVVEAKRKALVDRHNAGATQEDGPFKLAIETVQVNTVSYKDAVEHIRNLNCTFINGGGKPHLLNDKMESILAEATEPKPRTTVKVEANV